jgi:predicted enzyme related to lactoylglutathione lyase
VSTTLYAITFDCDDPREVAKFWAAVFDSNVDGGASDDFASIALGDNGTAPTHWLFNRVPESKQTKNRVHVDLVSHDRAREVKRLIKLGATHLAEIDEGGSQWTTLADPEGNEFDVIAADNG